LRRQIRTAPAEVAVDDGGDQAFDVVDVLERPLLRQQPPED
jgi:hypothetical protein